MCQCATPTGSGVGFRFWQDDVNLGVRFDGGQLTGDGGLPWVVEPEQALGVCAALAARVPEWRRGGVRHSLERLVRQRVFQIACGYEDQNDADRLRTDPAFKLACGRLPVSEADLASQPTLSRLENAVDRHAVEQLAASLVDLAGQAPLRGPLVITATRRHRLCRRQIDSRRPGGVADGQDRRPVCLQQTVGPRDDGVSDLIDYAIDLSAADSGSRHSNPLNGRGMPISRAIPPLRVKRQIPC